MLSPFMDEPPRRRLRFFLLLTTILALQTAPVIASQAAGQDAAGYRTPVRPGDPLDSRWPTPELYVNLSHRPRGVSASRFRYLVHKSARRWGIRVAGFTDRPPQRGDGINVIGFSRITEGDNGDTLAISTFIDGAPTRRELDVRLNSQRRWEEGPTLPAFSEWDLETVILHELGHAAGAQHTRRCLNSPMAPGLANGEWWRGSKNWFRYHCSNSAVHRRR
jgi:hypothetical protein